MAAYIYARVDIKDWDAYREYIKYTPAAIQKFEGRIIARGGEMITLEGSKENRRLVLIEFPSLDHAKAFYNSPEYIRIRKIREGAGDAQFVAFDGYAVEEWKLAVHKSLKLTPPV